MRALASAAAAFATAIALEPYAAARGCTETSDLVGRQTCNRYGGIDDAYVNSGWAVEARWPLVAWFAMRHVTLDVTGQRFDGGFGGSKHKPPTHDFSYRSDAIGLSTVPVYGFQGGFSYFVWDQLYVGTDSMLAFGSLDATFVAPVHERASGITQERTITMPTGVNAIAFHVGALAGYRLPLGRASLRGEAFFGVGSLTLSQFLEGSSTGGSSSADAKWYVEPRIAGDIWLTQHITVGAYAGINVIDGRTRALGLSFTWHMRAFDGDYVVW